MKNKKIIIAVAALLIVAAAVTALVIHSKKNNTDTFPTTSAQTATEKAAVETGFVLAPGLNASDLFAYSGEFVEDGSNEAVDNIAAIIIRNTGKTDYEYIEFTLKTEKNEYSFKASSVLAGTVTTVLCKDKKAFDGDGKVASGELTLESEYAAAPSLRDDLFKLYLQDGTLNIQNISGKDLDGSIVVYYKGADENGFFGGITYRMTIEGLKKDSIAQRHSEHIGEVVNITYGE